MPVETIGYACPSVKAPLAPWKFAHRDLKPTDVHVRVKYCGVCHSDLHKVKNEWGAAIFPMVPGHEITGVVVAVGHKVQQHAAGDKVAVGCFVDCCHECDRCGRDMQQHCKKIVPTYNARHHDGTVAYGGYARDIVVEERFVFKVPDNLDMATAAPLLCAGITTWAPMMECGMNQPGKKIGVIGLGGLGHMAVKFGVAWGNEVTVISRSPTKEKEAKELLGAKSFLLSTDKEQMEAAKESLDFIIDTACAGQNIEHYMSLLTFGGAIVFVGLPPKGQTVAVTPTYLVHKKHRMLGSLVGGIKQTQEMLDFCGKNNVSCIIELIPMSKINEAYERMEHSDVKYRFVLDVEGTCPDSAL